MFLVKLRAWVPRDKEMFHVRSILFDKELVALTYDEDDEPAFFEHYNDIVLMQYTWLYDDKGIEIYIGDIVEVHHKSETTTPYLSEVIMSHDGALVHSHPAHRVLGFGEWEQLSKYSDYGNGGKFDVRCKIVGNIYENPELLEVE